MPVCSHVLLSEITFSFLTFTNKTQWFFIWVKCSPGLCVFFPLLLPPVNPFYALELEDDILLHHVRQHHNFFQQTISNLAKQTGLNKDRQPSINKGPAPGPARQAQRCIVPTSRADVLTLERRDPCRLTALPVTRCSLCLPERRVPVGGGALSAPEQDWCFAWGPFYTLHRSGLSSAFQLQLLFIVLSLVPFCLWALWLSSRFVFKKRCSAPKCRPTAVAFL